MGTNTLAFPLLLGMALASGERSDLSNCDVNVRGIIACIVSTIGGIGISWAGWNCREKTSATTYTLLGVISKLISVLLNVMIWDKHATPTGICWLVVCIFSSSFYRQAPLRKRDVATNGSGKESAAATASDVAGNGESSACNRRSTVDRPPCSNGKLD